MDEPTPLKNDGDLVTVGMIFHDPKMMGKIIHSCSKAPTREGFPNVKGVENPPKKNIVFRVERFPKVSPGEIFSSF